MAHARKESGRGACREIAPGVYWLPMRGVNVYFVRAASAWALIDSGWAGSGPAIRAAAASLFGADARPAAILLTHVHPDHCGSARELARVWGCPVCIHPDELPLATGNDRAALMRSGNPLDHAIIFPVLRRMPRVWDAMNAKGSLADVVRVLAPGAWPDLPGWQAIPTPGHAPGHLAFFREDDRVLIAGDAVLTIHLKPPWVWPLWTVRQGRPVFGVRTNAPRLPPWWINWNEGAARASVGVLARLEPRVLACGHGTPMIGDETAPALHAFAARLAGGATEMHAPHATAARRR